MVINYELIAQDPATGARAGLLHTPHGTFKTPMFMPVGTQATVKTVTPDELKRDGGPDYSWRNTYHLFLRPGTELIGEAGGAFYELAKESPYRQRRIPGIQPLEIHRLRRKGYISDRFLMDQNNFCHRK